MMLQCFSSFNRKLLHGTALISGAALNLRNQMILSGLPHHGQAGRWKHQSIQEKGPAWPGYKPQQRPCCRALEILYGPRYVNKINHNSSSY